MRQQIQETDRIFKNTEPATMKHVKFPTITPVLTGQGLFSFLDKVRLVLKWTLQFTRQLFCTQDFSPAFVPAEKSFFALKVVEAIKAGFVQNVYSYFMKNTLIFSLRLLLGLLLITTEPGPL